jgi:hypothetical protein
MNIQMRLNVKIIYDHACDNEKDNLEYSLTFSNVYWVLEHNMCFLTSWSTSINFIFFPLGMTNLPCNIHCHYYIYCRAIMCNTPCYSCLLILLGFRMEAYQVVMAVAIAWIFQRLLKILEGLNLEEFSAILFTFSAFALAINTCRECGCHSFLHFAY